MPGSRALAAIIGAALAFSGCAAPEETTPIIEVRTDADNTTTSEATRLAYFPAPELTETENLFCEWVFDWNDLDERWEDGDLAKVDRLEASLPALTMSDPQRINTQQQIGIVPLQAYERRLNAFSTGIERAPTAALADELTDVRAAWTSEIESRIDDLRAATSEAEILRLTEANQIFYSDFWNELHDDLALNSDWTDTNCRPRGLRLTK